MAEVADWMTQHWTLWRAEVLKALDPDGMSPREAMDALYKLKGLLAG